MREKFLFDFDWLFFAGDIPVEEPQHKSIHSYTERVMEGPAAYKYTEYAHWRAKQWKKVDLPHDYIISQQPDAANIHSLGYFTYHNAWYRKHFRLEEADRDRRIVLFFEGVATNAMVYVNGCLMVRNFCGYTSFEADITDVARFGEDNVVAVYVDASDHEGWWYEGAGIYRHVWLIKTDLVAVDRWGVYVSPQALGSGRWRVPVETAVRNDGQSTAAVTVESAVVDAEGSVVASIAGDMTIPVRNTMVLTQEMTVQNPVLWDTEHPTLYTLRTRLLRDGEEIDRTDTRFGFRTIRFDADEGFFLNDKLVKIKGVCCHQDYGLTGKAMPDRIHRYRLRRMKEMGANGYRTSHYPHAEATMDALDEMGFLVMDETRRFESTKEGLEQLEMLIRRDRNRPSVIMWSIGNEDPLHMTDQGKRIAQTMTAFIHGFDTTRPVTSAVTRDVVNSPVFEALEVVGVNYHLEQYEAVREKYPQKPFVASEVCASYTTRGWYLADSNEREYYKAWDHGIRVREYTWQHIMARPWVMGGYQWAGIEHRGETQWPRLSSQSGALDLFLQPKDAFYQNLSHWSDKHMVHILPHWNLPGREGETIPVWVYTNCEEIELWQDGNSLGTLRPEPFGHGEWSVIYAPGTLRVEGRMDGKTVAAEEVKTTGMAVALKLRLEDGDIKADGEDMAIITCYCVDTEGSMVPDACPMVSFNTNELGRIVGTGSDVCDHTPVPSLDRRMRAGLISVAVKVGDQPGTLRVYARADGLVPVRLDIDVASAERRPFI